MPSVRPYAVLDIDGVLADVRHRLHHVEARPKDWDSFFADAPQDPLLPEGLELALNLTTTHEILYLTGRPERCRRDTQAWLDKFGFPPGQLLMRSQTDRRPARITKVERLNGLQQDRHIAMFVDDDAKVVRAARDAGYEVVHATWMSEAPADQRTLFDAQELEGRT